MIERIIPYDWETAADVARRKGRPDWADWLKTGHADITSYERGESMGRRVNKVPYHCDPHREYDTISILGQGVTHDLEEIGLDLD